MGLGRHAEADFEMDMLPDRLASYERAQMFPARRRQAIASIKRTLIGQAERRIAGIEAACRRRSCPTSSVTQVENVPGPAWLRAFYRVSDPGSSHIATQIWTVRRCDATRRYSVHYFGAGDFFFNVVLPCDAMSTVDYCRSLIMDLF
ncbi:unnamed protein product (mitochondrion) [Plasmodiophora brassicae]|uniref:Uncharacterized protein n=1 Tax=Plasmodiophora brassicae TaxID=37360 RepID=A0A0G4IUK4_PLABS|nr:hypothetical protein PBRA_006890 [Plasmodiophora brassicae]SPR00596.1 unnamed protein product [Plasmodiophora brassicae]